MQYADITRIERQLELIVKAIDDQTFQIKKIAGALEKIAECVSTDSTFCVLNYDK